MWGEKIQKFVGAKAWICWRGKMLHYLFLFYYLIVKARISKWTYHLNDWLGCSSVFLHSNYLKSFLFLTSWFHSISKLKCWSYHARKVVYWSKEHNLWVLKKKACHAFLAGSTDVLGALMQIERYRRLDFVENWAYACLIKKKNNVTWSKPSVWVSVPLVQVGQLSDTAVMGT